MRARLHAVLLQALLVYWSDESESDMMALPAPVKVTTGRTCEQCADTADTHELQKCVLTHQGPHLKSWNILIFGLFEI